MNLYSLYKDYLHYLKDYPFLQTVLFLVILVLIVGLVNYLLITIISWLTRFLSTRILKRSSSSILKYKLINRFSNLISLFILYFSIPFIPKIANYWVKLSQNICQSLMIWVIGLIFVNALKAFSDIYSSTMGNTHKTIKGYLQLIQIIIMVFTILLMIGNFLHKDIFNILAGLGALTAVFMLVFQNTILSFVASLQVSSYDIVRMGDWIEMPSFYADGEIIDISLHLVKVQNWDKTISVIPTSKLVTDSFKNWRGMKESGGRRIKRSVLIDLSSIHFLTESELEKLSSFSLIDEYLKNRIAEITKLNENILKSKNTENISFRKLTNIGTLRAYLLRYLKFNPNINANMTLMVRYLEPTNFGLPLEVYCFSKKTDLTFYEEIQSDIFDHLISVLPEFGLRLGQQPIEKEDVS